MPATKAESIAYGDGSITVQVPEHTRVLRPNAPLPPIPDLRQAVREALYNPIAHEPVNKLVSPRSKVVICFDDASGAAWQTEAPDFRRVGIEVLVEELGKAGVPQENITLMCTQGLHRKLTRIEMESFLGRDLVLRWGYNRLFCHDAEDRDNIVHLGQTRRGFDVEVNRLVADSDQLFYLSCVQYPFNGGWKSLVIGAGTFNVIRHTHRPWPQATGQSVDDPEHSAFKKLVWEQGAVLQRHLESKGRRIFTIETAYNNASPRQVVALHAGHPTEVHPNTLRYLQEQQAVEVEGGQSDVLVCGVPSVDGYSKFSVFNPILLGNTIGAYAYGSFQGMPLVREGGILIVANPARPAFDERYFPSYLEFWHKLLPQNTDPYWLWENFAEDFAHRPEYVYSYRHRYAYHGAHPFFMWNQTLVVRRQVRVWVAGVPDAHQDVVRHMGFTPFPSVEAALAAAQAELGADCSVTLLERPRGLIPRVKA
ncbi:MAG: DUF2088 domain-containing protein [Chloroflexi bacterium]|nr:DUF2088 domain-containing protein [Chloroflexota bacterium]